MVEENQGEEWAERIVESARGLYSDSDQPGQVLLRPDTKDYWAPPEYNEHPHPEPTNSEDHGHCEDNRPL
jgi:hypothetical protein